VSITSSATYVEAHVSSHFQAMLEEQLADDREWLFDTVSPSYADIALFAFYKWIQPFPSTKGLFDPTQFARTMKVSNDSVRNL
jgi:glutathione S-transferase